MPPRKTPPPPLSLFFLLFTFSGFSGLIYESIWTHYLKLFLGHAAYAQTLVLAIFMGGMALGSWICSSFGRNWKNLLLGYALAEGTIGICALFFHTVFDSFVSYAYTDIIPGIGSPGAVSLFKWTVSSLLILPQSVLLGMTFPLMSAGVLRIFPDKPGRSISLLYFTNSIGASVGALVSGFLLIGLAGLPGTIQIAGCINLALAAAVWLLVKDRPAAPAAFGQDETGLGPATTGWFYLLLFTSLITGAASFIYEIGWIRMLVLVLGSSTHAFELMLSAFILGLALGGLWIQHRIDTIASPLRFLVFVQVVMGLLALSTIPLYGNTFMLMQWLVKTLPKTDTGYLFFNLAIHGIAIAVMLPATFCAGMTLPLITYSLLRRGYGEKSIGAVYAYNTVGAIAGVFFAIHLGMPRLGLKGLMVAGAALDMGLGLVLLRAAAQAFSRRLSFAVAASAVAVLAAVIVFVHPDPYKMASGVYRNGVLMTPDTHDLVFHKDGKTATVSVTTSRINHFMSIRTNGKSDAGINMKPVGENSPDEATMILSGFLPMAHFPDASTAANIGLGSGLTTQVLLTNPRLKQVDTIEIEKFMVEGAEHFRPRTELVYTDPRSHIYIDDAKTFFSLHNRKYDIIISEPSNPWVSGVASLFSEEFYRRIREYLSDQGLLVQWMQLYEINTDLVASVLKALSPSFSDFGIYVLSMNDLVIVAKKDGPLGRLQPDILLNPQTQEALARIHIQTLQDVRARKIGDRKSLGSLLPAFPLRANSDYYPVLDLHAAKTYFMKSDAMELITLAYEPLPVLDMLGAPDSRPEVTDITPIPFLPQSEVLTGAMALRDFILSGSIPPKYAGMPDDIRDLTAQYLESMKTCGRADEGQEIDLFFRVAVQMVPYLSPAESDAVISRMESGPCRTPAASGKHQWQALFRAVGRRDAEEMASRARGLIEREGTAAPARFQYLLAAAMLGDIASGNTAGARQTWTTYGRLLSEKGKAHITFRLLEAHAFR